MTRIQDLLKEEEFRANLLRERKRKQFLSQPLFEKAPEDEFLPRERFPNVTPPRMTVPQYQPQRFEPIQMFQPTPVPETPTPIRQPRITRPEITEREVKTKPVKKEEPPIEVPFWQRALQVFSAPFEWVDENIIKPSLAVGATEFGAIEDVERLPGEDYFEWKKRSWEEWKAPGIDITVPWGDGDITIDLKGVLEFAPWFLLPGAGQVGTAARAGFGVAGMLGKLGRAGRVLGTAVEISPWGMVEKGARQVIKPITGLATRGTAKIGEKIVGKVPEPAVEPEVQSLIKAFKEVVSPQYEKFVKEGIPRLRARQLAGLEDVKGQFARGEITRQEYSQLASKAMEGGVKGEYAVDLAGRFTQEAKEKLYNRILTSAENGYITNDTYVATVDLLANGVLPEPHHVKALARILGKDFADAVRTLKGVRAGKKEKFIDFLNFPRAVLASTDLSGAGRQGLILSLMRPTKVPRWFGRQLKAFYSEKMAGEIDATYRAHPKFNDFIKEGNYWAPLEKGAEAFTKEETYMSRFAHMFPLVRRSERAFLTYTNSARFESWLATRNVMEAIGTAADKRLLAKFYNAASGRGDMPKSLERFAPALNTMLFSTRYQVATLELPFLMGRMLLSKNPYMRKEAARALVAFAGAGASLMGILKATGQAEIELDPRSGDFGKIIIGGRKTGTRLDIWRGYVQYIRFANQFLTGERKSAYGNMNKSDRYDIALRFLQSKASPAAGLLVDLAKGENYMGEPMFQGTTGAIKMARNRMMPIALQDIIDAMEQHGMNGAWTASPAILGIGTLTYVNDLVRVQNKIARNAGFKSWNEVDPATKRKMENNNAELQAALMEFDRRVMGTAWGDWRLAGKAIDETFKENVRLAVDKYRSTGDGYQFRKKISDAFTARRGGYAAREKQERFAEIVRRQNIDSLPEALATLSPEQLAIKTYFDALFGDDMYDEFGDYKFDEAEIRKEQLRAQLGEELYNYAEEYQGLKYEDLPVEFHELAEARKTLKPYWKIRDEVERLFGKKFADSPRGQQLITKQRQMLRRTNPELERAYQMFYTRS